MLSALKTLRPRSFSVKPLSSQSRRLFSTNVMLTSSATAQGGRGGSVKSADGSIDMQLKLPKTMGGSGEAGPNPETFFAAGYAACFNGAFNLVAGKQGKKLPSEPKITATVRLVQSKSGFDLEVDLVGAVNGLDKKEVESLMKAAHEVCPYSKATRNNIKVNVSAA